MIRAFALLAMMALPANAQDFRGLLPGMSVSDIARLGEPFDLLTEDGETYASYPLPFERVLVVVHSEGQIMSIALMTNGANPPLLPPSDGLRVGETTLREAVDMAGSEGFTFDGLGTVMGWNDDWPTGFRLLYDLPDHPDLILELVFALNPLQDFDASEVDGFVPLPPDATLEVVRFNHIDYIAHHPDYFGATRTPRPDAEPFAAPLKQAFPLAL